MNPRAMGIINRTEIIALLLSLVLIGILLALRTGGGAESTAHVSVRGDMVIELHLGDDQDIDLAERYGVPVRLEVRGGQVRFAYAVCPDQICVNTGWISMGGQSAVCMPNRTAVVIVGR